MQEPVFSQEYLEVTARLLGKDISNITPEQLVSYESVLYDLNMGFYTTETQTPFSSVGYFKEENEFYHPLSLKETGKRYGFNKLEQMFPIDTFLKLPACMVDDLIEGLTEGKQARAKVDQRLEKESGGGDGGVTREEQEAYSHLHKLLSKMMKTE